MEINTATDILEGSTTKINVTAEEGNVFRQIEFDYVKALAILGMIIIHVYEELSNADCSVLCSNFYDGFIQFFGGPLAAPVFTFAMGMGIVYSRHNDPDTIIKRGIKIFIMGYILNICKDAVPLSIQRGYVAFDDMMIYNIANVDVYMMDGLAYILIGLFRKFNMSYISIGATALLMQAAGVAAGALIAVDSLWGLYLGGLFIYTGEGSYFPLTLWFVYVASGMLFAKYLRHVKSLDVLYKRCLLTSAGLLLCYCVSLAFSGYDLRNFFALADNIYYRQDFLSLIFTYLVVITELSLAHFVFKRVKLPYFNERVKFMSSNLDIIYIVQWLLIGWTHNIILPMIGSDYTISSAWVIPVGLLYTVLAYLITKGYRKLKDRS